MSLSSLQSIGALKASQQRDMLNLLRRTYVGLSVADLPTPSLVVHADAAEQNKASLETIIRYLRKKRDGGANEIIAASGDSNSSFRPHPLRIRPHAKLHKSRVLAERILRESDGSNLYSGVCVQKVSEAELLSGYFDDESRDSSFYAVKDIFISNEVGTLSAARRVSALHNWMCQKNAQVKQGPYKLAVCVDSVDSVKLMLSALSELGGSDVYQPLSIFIEVNIGQHRGGAKVSGESLQPIVSEILAAPSLMRLQGLHAYHGGAQHIRDPQERANVMRSSMELTRKAKDIIEQFASSLLGTRFHLNTITGAGTGTFAVGEASSPLSVYNEIQPGSYFAMDRDYLANRAIHIKDLVSSTEDPLVEESGDADLVALLERRGSLGLFEPAMYIKASVVSKTIDDDSSPSRVVIDSGHKSSAIDSGLPCLAPWQTARLVGEGSSEWANTYLVECVNGGDDHMGFAASLIKFVRCGGDGAEGETPSPVIDENVRKHIGTRIVEGLSLGDSVWIIPGHCDPTFNLHDYFFIVRGSAVGGGIVEDVAMVDARGCQQ